MIIETANKYYRQLYNDIRAAKKYIHNNFGIFLTILYLLGSVSGIVYLYVLLDCFSIDIFNFIDISDFLLALLSNSLLIFIYTLIIIFLVLYFNLRLGQVPEPRKKTLLNKIYNGLFYPLFLLKPSHSLILFLALITFSYPCIVAYGDSKAIINEKTKSYHLSLNYPIDQSRITHIENVQIVTSTTGNLFVYDNKQDKLLIIPHTNVSGLVPNENKEKMIQPEAND